MKERLAAVALYCAIVLVVAALFLPPTGVVDPSVIYIFAQLLVFSATMLGVDHIIDMRLRKPKEGS